MFPVAAVVVVVVVVAVVVFKSKTATFYRIERVSWNILKWSLYEWLLFVRNGLIRDVITNYMKTCLPDNMQYKRKTKEVTSCL